MDCHAKNRSKYGFIQILAESKAMKQIDKKWPRTFKDEPLSIMFGVAIDGVCPFSFIISNYSVWTIGLIVYNIPPWISARNEYPMFILIILGKHQVKNMDVYLEPFIDETKLLWKGIRMYDISHPPSNRPFMFYGVLCWIIHDFLRLGVCFGKIIILHIYTHNLFSSQLSYFDLYYYFDVINITN